MKDNQICGTEEMPKSITPLEAFTQRIETLSDRSAVLENRLIGVTNRLLGDIERESELDRASPPKSNGGEYNNMNYAIAILCDRIDDLESAIQIIEQRF